MSRFFLAQSSRIRLPKETKAISPLKVGPLLDWHAEDAYLEPIIASHFTTAIQLAYPFVSSQLGMTVSFDMANPYVAQVMDRIGSLVSGINATSMARLQDTVQAGITQGSGIDTIARNIQDQLSGWAGIGDIDHSRSMVIARTETATAYNGAAVAGYRDSGIVGSSICLDSADCGLDGHNDPEKPDGLAYSLDDADMYPLSHPNCVRAWAPNIDTGSGQLADEPSPDAEG
jgi:hypothetical protein